MRNGLRWLSLVLVLNACDTGGGDDGDDAPATDAAMQCGLYEMCLDTTNGSDCASGICRVYNMLGANGCTQACDASNPCPDDTMGPVSCNMMGVCRPNVLTACTP